MAFSKPRSTFLDETKKPTLSESRCAMLGIGFDLTASFGKGTRLGPAAIIGASRQVEFESGATGKSLDEKVKVHNLGTLEYNYKKKLSEKQIEKETRKMVNDAGKLLEKPVEQKKFLMIFGGDHSVTNATLNALTEKIDGKKISWLRLDAHLDLRQALEHNPLSHGSIGRRVFDKGIKQVFVGIRDQISAEEQEFIEKNNLADDVFYFATQPEEMYDERLPAWMKKENISFTDHFTTQQVGKILSKLDREYLFINIDIDALDANEFHGTGTPVPFGMSYRALNNLLYATIKNAEEKDAKILGFDIVEVFPILRDWKKGYSFENAAVTTNEMKAALLAYNLLNWVF
ncbi:MAG: arginase family protein [Candidatus Diapherotrites archaeon]|nr:arginase family protein [Candidatus Diapherotrites archaeon]